MVRTRYILASLFIVALLISVANGDDRRTVSIGALVDATGDWASQGSNSKVALETAVEDINGYLESMGSVKRVDLTIKDTGSDPARALEELQNLNNNRIKVVIAATTTAELAAVKSYADRNKIMIVGTASTGPSLSIEDDSILRLAPDDTNQGLAMARVFKHGNIRAIVPIYRADAWGKDLLKATTDSFRDAGGIMLEGVKYSPGTDFSSEVRDLSSLVKEAKGKYGPDKVGVYIISYDEAALLLTLAAKDDELSSVKWFGSDGMAGIEAISRDSTMASFAIRVGMIAPRLAILDYKYLRKEYKNVDDIIYKKTGAKPSFYTLASYDALWACAESMIGAGSIDPGQIREVLIHTINRYNGVTSSMVLNSEGDKERAIYDLAVIKESNGSYYWGSIGMLARWDADSNDLTWIDS